MRVTHNICFIVQPGEACAADRLSALIVSWKTGESLLSCWTNTLHERLFSDNRWCLGIDSVRHGVGSRQKSGHACMHACYIYAMCHSVSMYVRVVRSRVRHTARRSSLLSRNIAPDLHSPLFKVTNWLDD